ncbi:DUF2232 domain-containing protein [Paenibacillus pini]|uniref:DUF2232 domain-containing protein n=1 Tax=Paenibacillus pini JCM 16418 TaxID=1236976 RepID=W7Z1K8_9BACL|nr:DUF2232 domain-containing protein [Paenibacillus pini]GAF08259.1 hypothetical protein JCM16418_2321 [Paenibacillus pini JCM 16418]
MKLRWTSIAWSIMYLLLLLSLKDMSLGIVTVLFLVLPATLLYSTLNLKMFLLHIIPIWLLAFMNDRASILLAVYFIIPSLVMGHCYKRKASALRTLVTGTLAILAEMLLILLIGTIFFQFDLSFYVEEIIRMTLAPLQDAGTNNRLMSDMVMVWTNDDMINLSNMTMRMIPFAMIICAFMMAVVTHSLARPILNTLGFSVPKLKPAREWMLPRSLIWYYFIGVIIEFFARGSHNYFLILIASNLVPLLHIFFMVQAIGFFFYLAHTRKWHPILPILMVVVILLIPPMRIVGILDLAFPLRQMMTKSKR